MLCTVENEMRRSFDCAAFGCAAFGCAAFGCAAFGGYAQDDNWCPFLLF